MESEFYSIKELAVIYSVHEVTIRRAIHKGFIEAVRIGDCPKSPYRISKRCIHAVHEALLRDMAKKVKK